MSSSQKSQNLKNEILGHRDTVEKSIIYTGLEHVTKRSVAFLPNFFWQNSIKTCQKHNGKRFRPPANSKPTCNISVTDIKNIDFSAWSPLMVKNQKKFFRFLTRILSNLCFPIYFDHEKT